MAGVVFLVVEESGCAAVSVIIYVHVAVHQPAFLSHFIFSVAGIGGALEFDFRSQCMCRCADSAGLGTARLGTLVSDLNRRR
jgi:hypothetical protein